MKTGKQITIVGLSVLLLFLSGSTKGQSGIPIKKATVYAQNMWFLDINTPNNLDSLLARVAASGVQYIRIGGIDPNFTPLYSWDPTFYTVDNTQATRLIQVIDAIRLNGMEPIIQVGYDPVCQNAVSSFSNVSRANQAKIAGELVKRINTLKYPLKPIKYWIISNEPDLTKQPGCSPLRGFSYDTDNVSTRHADTIALYMKTFASHMKNQDPSIKIMGPEFSGYGNDAFGPLNNIMNKLISDTSNSFSIMGKIPGINQYVVDIISFHYYPDNGGNGLTFKEHVRRDPTLNKDGFRGRLNSTTANKRGIVNMILNNPNTYRSIDNLKIACTEFNLELGYGLKESVSYTAVIDGHDNRSFLGGQWFAEVMGEAFASFAVNGLGQKESWVEFMCPWSIKEGNDSVGLGYLSASPTYKGRKRPMYHHYKLMAEHIKGVFHPMSTVATNTMVKGFASIEMPYGYKVMLMNMDSVNDFHFRINFGTSNPLAGGSTVTAHIPLAGDPALGNSVTTQQFNSGVQTGTVTSEPIYAQSTIILVFDCHGNILHRIDYKAVDAKNNQPPSIVQIGDNPVDDDMIMCGLPGGIGGTISTNLSFLNTTVPITSNITLSSNVSLTFTNCLIVMSEGTKITGTRQNKVILKNSIMVGCGGLQYEGISLSGNYQTGEAIILDSAIIINANHPVVATRIPEIKIKRSVLVNGVTALEFNEAREYSVSECWIGGFTSGINTSASVNDYAKTIDGNRIMEVDSAIRFKNCGNNMLDITCNDLRFRQVGIQSNNVDLKPQGSTAQGAGNRFAKTLWPDPSDYLFHTGNTTSYKYGPGEASMFPYTSVMNISNTQAAANRDCDLVFTNCEVWPEYTAIDEAFERSGMNMLVFPNPGTGTFSLEVKNKKGKYTLSIHDMMGRLISSGPVDLDSEKTVKFEIKMKGLYIVSLQNENERFTQKVIVE